MFDNIRNVFTNRNFQFGVGGFAILAVLVWFFTGSQEADQLITEDASTATTPVEVTEHDQTPTTQSQEETEQNNVDVDENAVND